MLNNIQTYEKISDCNFLAFLATGCSQSVNVANTASTPTPNSGKKIYTLAEVSQANSKENCLTVINGNVYDLTKWIDQHPGGNKNILKICGIDGAKAFENKHGEEPDQNKP